ncbi:IS3 family transposase [Actinosynnema sp. NPDC023794]
MQAFELHRAVANPVGGRDAAWSSSVRWNAITRRVIEAARSSGAAGSQPSALTSHAVVQSCTTKRNRSIMSVTMLPSPESFFATIKTELLDRQPWPTRTRAHKAILEYVEGWYNTRRHRMRATATGSVGGHAVTTRRGVEPDVCTDAAQYSTTRPVVLPFHPRSVAGLR